MPVNDRSRRTDRIHAPETRMAAKSEHDTTTQARFEDSTVDKLRRRARDSRADEAGRGGIARFLLDCPAEADVDDLAELYQVWKQITGENPVAEWSRRGGSE